MIVVDSSVWIDHLHDRETWQVLTLRRLIRRDMAGPILVGDIIMYEVLAGLRSARATRSAWTDTTAPASKRTAPGMRGFAKSSVT